MFSAPHLVGETYAYRYDIARLVTHTCKQFAHIRSSRSFLRQRIQGWADQLFGKRFEALVERITVAES